MTAAQELQVAVAKKFTYPQWDQGKFFDNCLGEVFQTMLRIQNSLLACSILAFAPGITQASTPEPEPKPESVVLTPKTLPDGLIVNESCTDCHELNLSPTTHPDTQNWVSTVTQFIRWATPTADEQ